MKCFTHGDADGVGCCRSCGRAVCHACCVDVGKGIACKDRCEDDVRAYVAALERSISQLSTTASMFKITRVLFAVSGWILVVVGLGFGVLALGNAAEFGGPTGVSILFGLVMIFASRRMRRLEAIVRGNAES